MRLIVVDAHPSTRERIAPAFAGSSEFQIVAFCPDANATFLMADLLEPDVFLIDPLQLHSDGYAVIRTLRICVPGAAVVAFTYPSTTRAVLEAFRSGAQGFVLKTDPIDSLFEALRAVFRGGYHLSEAALVEMRREFLPDAFEDQPSTYLTATDRALN
jgi:DNA-binding NarL/FixJ family response regulator